MHPWDEHTCIGHCWQAANGATFEEILKGYPDLGGKDMQPSAEYAPR